MAIKDAALMSDRVFLPTPEAADRLNLAASTLEKYRCTGNGPDFLRLSPKRIVYDVAALDGWARARSFNSTAQYPNQK
jgi:hypothetical protein